MQKEKYRIVFSGSGGQGVITASIIVAEAAALYSSMYAVQSQSYGPEARGSATRSDVIISSNEIYFPKVLNPHMLVCLTQEAYSKFSDTVVPGGTIIYDPYYVKPARASDAIQKGFKMYECVVDKLNMPIAFNICMLGVFTAETKILKKDAMMEVIAQRVPAKFKDVNLEAFNLGLNLKQESA